MRTAIHRRVVARLLWAFLLGSGLACAGPGERTERALELDLPADWSVAPGTEVALDADWWRDYGDEQTWALVEEALQHNPDLSVFAAAVLAADASRRITSADRLPQASLGLGADRSKRNFIGFPGASGGAAGGPSSSDPFVSRSTVYGLSLDTSWELDLWNRLGAAESAAEATSVAARADYEAARISLIGAVLKAWFGLVEADAQVSLSERTLQSWTATHALVDRRFQQGLRPALDARLSAADVARAQASLELRQRLRQDAVRALELLLGRYPAAELEATEGLPVPETAVPDGMPATLLARRADLFAAERRLVAAEFRVDSARAAFYPDLSLTTSVGTSGPHLSDVLDGDFSVWRVLGRAVQPLFDGGRLTAQLDLADAAAESALAVFTSAVLRALAEVEAALDAERWLAAETATRVTVASEAGRARELATDRYSLGLLDVNTLLDAERGAFLAESFLLSVKRQRLHARIDLHLALGGGFDASAGAPTPDPEAED